MAHADFAFLFVYWGGNLSIGILSTVIGLLVLGLTRISQASLLLILICVAYAIANGLTCSQWVHREIEWTSNPLSPAPAVLIALQEFGLTYYAYLVFLSLKTAEDRRTQRIFKIGYWLSTIAIALPARVASIVYWQNHQESVAFSTDAHNNKHAANYASVVYFVGIAIAETWTAFFLLKNLYQVGYTHSPEIGDGNKKSSHFTRLCRSTELRIAPLCIVGLARVLTFSVSLKGTGYGPEDHYGVADDLFRFLYVTECWFPLLMMIDMMANELSRQYTSIYGSDDSQAPAGFEDWLYSNATNHQGQQQALMKSEQESSQA